jgi:tripartite-type tricarboxylate transporter receptor subunit TctC
MRGVELACRALVGAVLFAPTLAASETASAADTPEFFHNKTVEFIISTGVGGGLDTNARIVARHLGNHIPGKPAIVAKNMPGAGHVRAANFLYNQAPRDGTVIGSFIPAFVMAQVLERTSAIQFDAADFQWIGSTSSSNSTVYVWKSSNVASLEDAKQRPVSMGATGAGSYTGLYPNVMNSVLGTKFKVVSGYQSTNAIGLAMERGEVEGRAGNNFNSLKTENAEWLRSGRIVLLAQVGLERDREFPQVPLLLDLAKTEEERQILRLFSTDVVIGRPFLTTPGVPAERVKLLRKAFDDMVRDPAFLREAREVGLDVTPVAGAEVQRIVEDLVRTPAEIVAKAKRAMAPASDTRDAK